MKKQKKKRVVLCPTCKTGADCYELDNLSEACPYLGCYTGHRCAFYVPMSDSLKKGVFPDLFSKIKRIFRK